MAASLETLPSPNVATDPKRPGAKVLLLTLDYGPDTAETAQANLREIGHYAAGGGWRLLIDLRMATDQTESARICYRHMLPHFVGPVAIVVGSNVSRFLGEFMVRTLKRHHEVRLFVNEDNARRWIYELA
jgi:hypothetical protein